MPGPTTVVILATETSNVDRGRPAVGSGARCRAWLPRRMVAAATAGWASARIFVAEVVGGGGEESDGAAGWGRVHR
jgi:hypothetical protein